MGVLDGQVTDDRMKSTDWTAIGTRILEAATLATAIHLEELSTGSGAGPKQTRRALRWDRDEFDVNG